MKLLLIVLVYSVWLAGPSVPATAMMPLSAPAAEPNWKSYSNDSKGLSFQYPPYLQMTERSLEDFHVNELVLVLDVMSPKHPGSPVLRLLVKDYRRNPLRATPQGFSSLRKICKSYFELRLGGRRAADCMTCGRGACQWQIVIPGEMELTIISLLSQGGMGDQPRDSTYPLLSIIRTVRFKASG